LRRILQ